jgi:integrase
LIRGDNPTRGWPIPKEKNVRRPIATTDRYEALRRVSDQVMMTIGRGKKATKVRSYFSELLDLAYHTGRRISAIRQLRHEDLKLKEGPQGSILWPRSTDKVKRSWLVPMSKEVRAVIDRVRRDRPLSIAGYLFPSASDPNKAVRSELAAEWLERAEVLAELPHLEQGAWHCFRRGWATARKGEPVQDLMAIGGWESPVCLETLYTQADQATLSRIVNTKFELREVAR